MTKFSRPIAILTTCTERSTKKMKMKRTMPVTLEAKTKMKAEAASKADNRDSFRMMSRRRSFRLFRSSCW